MKTNRPLVSSHKLAAIVLAMLLVFTVAANAQSAQSQNGLAGTWKVQVTIQNCASGAPLLSFESMLAFHQGGTLSGTTSNPMFAPGQRTSDYGSWSYQGGQTYTAVSDAYILFNAGPLVRGTQRITQSITVSGDTFSSSATTQFYDANHAPHGPALCAVATGSRFE